MCNCVVSQSVYRRAALKDAYLVDVLWSEAKLLANADGDPSALGVGGLEVHRERMSPIVDGA